VCRITVVESTDAYVSAITPSASPNTASSLALRGSCGRQGQSQKTPFTCSPKALSRYRRTAARYSPVGSSPSGVSQPYVSEAISRS
jgi:hypothetical protein